MVTATVAAAGSTFPLASNGEKIVPFALDRDLIGMDLAVEKYGTGLYVVDVFVPGSSSGGVRIST